MWRVIVWLLGYLLAVVVVFDLIDWTYYVFGCNSPDFIDPAMLSVRQMQALLSVRGILPTAIYEKTDLADILKSSGKISATIINKTFKTLLRFALNSIERNEKIN